MKISIIYKCENQHPDYLVLLFRENSLLLTKSKSFPCQMGHRVAPIFLSITLGHMNAVKATVGGQSTGSYACSTSLLHSLNAVCLTRRQ